MCGKYKRRVVLVVLAGALLCGLGAAIPPEGTADPVAALNEGNRLFRNGRLEEAVLAYRAGYSPADPHPTLLYNLATALHHLDRLPEAVLFYRRASGSEDPWVEENLRLARLRLDRETLPPGGTLGRLKPWSGALRWSAVGLAWIGLVLLAWRSRLPLWAALAAGGLAAILYGGALVADRWGPRPAVLLKDCSTAAGELPAGTEAWVRRLDDGRYLVPGTGLVCPAAAVAPVFPEEEDPQ
jgi:hypothetical protein